jgi:Uma2 family endonuclease
MGTAAPIYYTADMVRAMPDDGNRYEVVNDELLVTPAPRPWHQILVHRLSLAIGNYLDRESGAIVRPRRAVIAFLKRLRYREAGVPLYWLVDGDERSVEVWTPSDGFPLLERERLIWHAAGAAPPFELDLPALFRPV